MKLDEGLEPRRASLDVTPLIDVVFLLVLFFAVTTSFISPEDLEALARRLTALTTSNAELAAQTDRQRTEIAGVRTELAGRDRALTQIKGELELKLEELEAATRDAETLRLAQRAMQQDQARSRETIEQLAARNTMLAEDVERLQGDLARLEAESARYRAVFDASEAQIERAVETEQVLNSNLNALLLDNTLNIERVQNQLTIYLSDKVLFDSASAEIKPAGLPILRSIGQVLKDKVTGQRVQIGGHTDNVPIRGLYGDNWALSAARAVNVVRFFETDVGIDPTLLSAVGFGENHPIASNETAAGRASNRRIELILLPQ
jgi:chemotaxis protein MotB